MPDKWVYIFICVLLLSSVNYALTDADYAALDSIASAANITNTTLFSIFERNEASHYNKSETYNRTEIEGMLVLDGVYANKSDTYNRTFIDAMRLEIAYDIDQARGIITKKMNDIIRNETVMELSRQNVSQTLERLELETDTRFSNVKRDYLVRDEFSRFVNETLYPQQAKIEFNYRQADRNLFWGLILVGLLSVGFGTAIYLKNPRIYRGLFVTTPTAAHSGEELITSEQLKENIESQRSMEIKIIKATKGNYELQQRVLKDFYDRIITDEAEIQKQISYHRAVMGLGEKTGKARKVKKGEKRKAKHQDKPGTEGKDIPAKKENGHIKRNKANRARTFRWLKQP